MIRSKWFNFGSRKSAAQATESATNPTDPNAKSVLIVDDDAVFVQATSMKLRAAGFQVRGAHNSSEALETLRDNKTDAVLMDIDFPPDVYNGGMASWDGFQLMNWLRSFPTAHNARFIIVTNSDSPQFRTRAAKMGAVAYLRKPLEHEQLCTAING